MTTPSAVRSLVEGWRVGGEPQQAGIPWPRQRWIGYFPAHTALFESLPDLLDRHAVRAACTKATGSPEKAVEAYLASMAWGYGRVGYGCWRTRRVLDDPAAGTMLQEAASELLQHGAQAAYRFMSNEGRLRGLGPAFGTKYLYFCPQATRGPYALILDRIVSDWLRQNVEVRLNPVPWSPAQYLQYGNTLAEWADDLEVAPDVIEERIFVTSASGQWATV